MKRILAILTALCLLGGACLAESAPADAAQPAALTAVGRAPIAQGKPSVMLLFMLETFGETVSDAQELARVQLSTLRETLADHDIHEENVVDTRYDVRAKYEYHYTELTETELLTGYNVTVALQAHVPDAHSVGTIIDAVNAAGLVCQYDLSYEYARDPEACDAALVLAAQEAMRRAGLLAQTAGVKLDCLVALEETLQEEEAVVRATYSVIK